MATWIFTTPTVAEAPFAWNPLMERFRIDRGISIKETAPDQWAEVRYDAYTNEIGAINLPQNWSTDAQWELPQAGLRYYRGGYEHLVNDATRASLIASGLVTEDNFTLPGGDVVGYGNGPYGRGGYGT